MRLGEEQPASHPQSTQIQLSETANAMPCTRCERLEAKMEKLENKLEKVEGQRDELADENRKLLKENCALRERLARLKSVKTTRMMASFLQRLPK